MKEWNKFILIPFFTKRRSSAIYYACTKGFITVGFSRVYRFVTPHGRSWKEDLNFTLCGTLSSLRFDSSTQKEMMPEPDTAFQRSTPGTQLPVFLSNIAMATTHLLYKGQIAG